MDPMDQIRETFFQECEELMEVLEDGLNTMEAGEHDEETVNAVFRAAHSIKGGAGAFGLDELVSFAHTFETTLDEVRAGRLEATAELMLLFLRAADRLRDLISDAQSGVESDAAQSAEIIEELKAFAGLEEEVKAEDFVYDAVPLDLDMDLGLPDLDLPDLDGGGNEWQITFAPHEGMYKRGNDCLLLIRALTTLGDARISGTLPSDPQWSNFDPSAAYLSWQVILPGDVDEADIREVFEFVEDDCHVDIQSVVPGDAEDDGADDWILNDLPEVDSSLPDLAQPEPESGASQEETPAPEEAEAAGTEEPKKEEAPEEAPAAEKTNAAAARKPKATIRVELDRVDRLINLIGELVINQSMLSQGLEDAGVTSEPLLADGLDEFKQLTRDIQEGVMAIRAQPIKPLFQRMSRIVREACGATKKSARLIIEGEATEVDKTIVERLSDPLTHMIRNAIDHGIEMPEVREASGKSTEGSVRLTAKHGSGRVLIELADDGAGVNRKKVREIAESKGLISPQADLSNSDIDNLLFMPGFSTAKEVTDLSGRGVGMDVVKRSIEALGGRVSISSMPGKGTTLSISLPLTLAVMDGMVVRVGDELMIIPIADISESLSPSVSTISTVASGQQALLVRGEFVPLIEISKILGMPSTIKNIEDAVVVLTESENGSRCALLVDAILDQRQVVIKGLEENYGHVPGVAAATILGDGRIALILDVASVIRSAETKSLSLSQVA